MRFLLLISSFYFSCLSFGQDSSNVDTNINNLTFPTQDTFTVDSSFSTVNKIAKKKKTPQKKKPQKTTLKEEAISFHKEIQKQNDESRNYSGLIFIGLLIILLIFVVYKYTTYTNLNKQNSATTNDEEYISDQISRIILPRREYYRNVYLKSEAWKRKRYVVLKRDNWTCVYCGGRATQVHHTRYAKRNIGKEPIEWLVSICRTCHASQH